MELFYIWKEWLIGLGWNRERCDWIGYNGFWKDGCICITHYTRLEVGYDMITIATNHRFSAAQ